MANIFKRLFKLGTSEANDAIDKMEDPVKMGKQVIRNLEGQLARALESLARMKALDNRLVAEQQKSEAAHKEWQSKAEKLRDRFKAESDEGKKEDLKSAMLTSLNKVENFKLDAEKQKNKYEAQKAKTKKVDGQIKKMKEQIAEYKRDMNQLEADAEMAKTSKAVAKEMSSINTDSATNIMERMKKKVETEEFMAEAYMELEDENVTDADRVDALLNENSPTADDDLLKDFLK